MSTTAETATAIRPFRAGFSEEQIDDLRGRIAATRWPSKELVADRSQGVQLAAAAGPRPLLAGRVRLRADRGAPERAAAVRHARSTAWTSISSTSRRRTSNALPLIMTHGWPGSVIELLDTVGPLTDPTAHGGSADDAFHLVLPSLPGYGLSGEPAEIGWDLGAHRTGLGRADAPARLHALRGSGRRRGRRRHRRDGPPGTRGPDRHPHQPARAGARRPDADEHGRGTRRGRADRHLREVRKRLLRRDGHPAADDRLRAARFARRSGGLDDRPRHGRLLQDRGAPSSRDSPRATSRATTSSTTSRCTG